MSMDTTVYARSQAMWIVGPMPDKIAESLARGRWAQAVHWHAHAILDRAVAWPCDNQTCPLVIAID